MWSITDIDWSGHLPDMLADLVSLYEQMPQMDLSLSQTQTPTPTKQSTYSPRNRLGDVTSMWPLPQLEKLVENRTLATEKVDEHEPREIKKHSKAWLVDLHAGFSLPSVIGIGALLRTTM